MPPIKKHPPVSRKLSPEKRAIAMALLKDPAKARELDAKAKQRIDRAYGYDPQSATEFEDFGKKAP